LLVDQKRNTSASAGLFPVFCQFITAVSAAELVYRGYHVDGSDTEHACLAATYVFLVAELKSVQHWYRSDAHPCDISPVSPAFKAEEQDKDAQGMPVSSLGNQPL
jgi:hypothetical protein